METDSLKGANVLVTGGSGSFGGAFVNALLTSQANRIIIFSRDPFRQEKMRSRLQRPDDARLRFFLGDVRDPERLFWACRGVDILVHAAALKSVTRGEYDPAEYVMVNTIGSINVASAAVRCGVGKLLLLSTDKAVEPINLYGLTKALSERFFVRWNQCGHPRSQLSAIRYGNVMDSRGGVLEVWRRQAREGRSLTVTCPEATRFWMSKADAVGLVMLSLDCMIGGEVFMPAGLRSVSVGELAKYSHPGHPTVVTGLQPGEKMHECLVSRHERGRLVALEPLPLFILQPEMPDWEYDPPPTTPVPLSDCGPEYTSRVAPRLEGAALRQALQDVGEL